MNKKIVVQTQEEFTEACVESILKNLNTKKRHIHILEVIIEEEDRIFDITCDRNDFIETLEKNFRNAEDTYITAKKIFEENLKLVDTSKIFEKLTDYEPSNWTKVITRILEFEEGTLDAGLRFCKKTGLDEEFKRLDMIKTSILYLKNLYPDISISDGEGIPYGK